MPHPDIQDNPVLDSRVTLNDLEAVMAVARRSSFRQAAVDLNVSTTALSQAIARLEANLQTRLFNRTTRSVALTAAGEMFLLQVGPALSDLRMGLDAVRSHNAEPSGVLRINAFATAARATLLPLVLEFLRQYPQVHVDLVTEGRLVDVVAEGFDLGVRAASLVPSDMIAVDLGQAQRYAVVGTPAYFDTHGRPQTPADLHKHACLRIRLPNGAIYPWPERLCMQGSRLAFSWSKTFWPRQRQGNWNGCWKPGRRRETTCACTMPIGAIPALRSRHLSPWRAPIRLQVIPASEQRQALGNQPQRQALQRGGCPG
jgi:DNA-binding transcriptional LysR family regulator